ncbi:UNVERIFIED_ORG: DNA/RNA endonuclease G (NUC1) [Rhizobium esperanzae]
MSEKPSPPATSSQETGNDRFGSLAILRVAHLDMMEGLKTQTRKPSRDIHAFIGKVVATGRLLADPEDRRAAQRVLDYWSAELLSDPEGEWSEAGPATLAAYQGAPTPVGTTSAGAGPKLGKSVAPDDPAPAESEAAAEIEAETRLRDRQSHSLRYVRLSALARQWRDSGLPGYLLSGDALAEAQEFRNDPDIAPLIKASQIAESDAKRSFYKRIIVALGAVIFMLEGILWYALERRAEAESQRIAAVKAEAIAVNARDEARKDRLAAEIARADAEAERDALRDQQKQTDAALADARKAQEAVEAARQAASRRVQDLEARQAVLDTTLGVVVTGLREGTLTLKDLPETVRTEALSRIADEIGAKTLQMAALPQELQDAMRLLVPDAPPSPFNTALKGYDRSFLPVDIPLPALSAARLASAFDDGRPVPYVNYSLVLDAGRRLALFSAVNYDQRLRRVVSQVPDQFGPDPRPQLRGVQADPTWFATPDILPARLAGRNDVSWSVDEISPLWLAELTDVYTNAVPQYRGTTSTTWATLEEWVRTEHNPAAGRITIFSGPVFAEAGDPVPRAFWKIAVSSAPVSWKQTNQQVLLPQKSAPYSYPGGEELIVDAFLVSNAPGDRSDKAAFDPDTHRVSIAELQRLTGLTFAAAIEAADSHANQGGDSLGQRLAASIRGLDGDVAVDRMRLAQQLITAIRDTSLPPDERQTVVAALVGMAQDASMRTLSATGRVNLLVVLAQVPAESWNAEGWLSLKAAARRAVADLEARASRQETIIGPQTRAPLDALKARIGLAERPRQTVYFQFAGMTRGNAVALSEAIQTLGWNVPNEERTPAASNLNEVRYNPRSTADKAAALMLAADLIAAGQENVVPKAVADILPGRLEVWVSI